jgi:hypothetical protein
VKRLPPAPIPAAVTVRLQGTATPPPTGMGRLIVDVPEGSAPISHIRFEPRQQDNAARRPTFRFFELPPELICTSTPCVIDAPRGNILLGFPVLGCTDGFEYELVHVSLQPSVYRRSLSVYEDNTGGTKITGIVLAGVGGAAVITGLPMLLAAGDNDKLAWAGGITLGAGALLLTIGTLLIRHDSATYRPGSANHYAAPPDAGGVGVPQRSPFDGFPAHDCGWSTRRGAG